MDVQGLFAILAGYLNFIIDFLMSKGMDQYTLSGTISPILVSYFVAGVFISYLIASVRSVPSYERLEQSSQPIKDGQKTNDTEAGASTQQNAPKEIDTNDMAGFILLSIVGALGFHIFLIVYNRFIFSAHPLGSVKDTLNAVLAYNAVYHPINALLKQLQKVAKAITNIGCGCRILALIIFLFSSVTYFSTVYYLLYSLAAAHGTTIIYMLWPTLLLVLVFFVITIIIARSFKLSWFSLFSTGNKK